MRIHLLKRCSKNKNLSETRDIIGFIKEYIYNVTKNY